MSSLELPADLGIEAAEPLRDALLKKVGGKQVLKLDAAQVGRMHAASLQVLAALFIQRRAAGLETRIENATDDVKSAARITGLSALLGLA